MKKVYLLSTPKPNVAWNAKLNHREERIKNGIKPSNNKIVIELP